MLEKDIPIEHAWVRCEIEDLLTKLLRLVTLFHTFTTQRESVGFVPLRCVDLQVYLVSYFPYFIDGWLSSCPSVKVEALFLLFDTLLKMLPFSLFHSQ